MCHKIKPISGFYAHKILKSGIREKCKECMKGVTKAHYRKVGGWRGKPSLMKSIATIDAAKAVGCSCGEKRVPTIDLHHRDPSTKLFEVNRKCCGRPEAEIVAEIAKCDPLCSNCHRMHHHNLRQQKGQVSP
jgi:hypothetical protein